MSEPALYNSILRAIAGGANRPNEIADRTGIAQTSLPRYLKVLANLGIIERVVPFGENPETSKRAIYRIMDACYDFWFRFVMPCVSDIESGLGEAIVDSIPDSHINDYLGRRFEGVCQEWLSTQAKTKNLPISAMTVGSWWGTNSNAKSQTDIDVLAANKVDKKMLIGECKYRNEFNVSEIVSDLTSKRALVKGYTADYFYVFSKHRIPEKIAARFPEVGFIALEDM